MVAGFVMHPLDNIVWHTLCRPHARYAVGTAEVRRCVRRYPPIVGFADLDHPHLSILALLTEPGEQIYCDGWAGAALRGWRIESESILCKTTWDGAIPHRDEVPNAVLLDRPRALATFASTDGEARYGPATGVRHQGKARPQCRHGCANAAAPARATSAS